MGTAQEGGSGGSPLVVPFARGQREDVQLLGGKGANLAEMTRLGMPVPPGFIITTQACRDYYARGEVLSDDLADQVARALVSLEAAVGRRLGDPADPLLVSVRSGAAVSMPGMMDTILNLGVGESSVRGLIDQTGDPRFSWDVYRRFIQLYATVVYGLRADPFARALSEAIRDAGRTEESELDGGELQALTQRYKSIVRDVAGRDVPQDPVEQLHESIGAVFRSWNSRRARTYRQHEGIPHDLGTAVTVQSMVFGNFGSDSGTGVAFTRNPSTGEAVPYGDFLMEAQGEDVVAGIRHTERLDALAGHLPQCHSQLLKAMQTLERHYRDLCDVEFTIERGSLYILQTRVGKRTAEAALRIAVDMVSEGLISERDAIGRVTPRQIDQLLHPRFAVDAEFEVLTTGLAASPGAAVGAVVLSADDAVAQAQAGRPVILVRSETSPDDVHGMIAAEGILTCRGGLASHAAVVARGMGKPAICGANEIHIDSEARTFSVGAVTVAEGDLISIDGTTGSVALGEMPVVTPEPTPAFKTLLEWADGHRRLLVRANADTAEDARIARDFGAEGIGLCRTEHMFLGERLPIVQRMILAETDGEETAALEELGALQLQDFIAILREMDGLPVTVRLLDPPLHEFLPGTEELAVADARGELDDSGRRLLKAAQSWQESNPMLGLRGCRLGIFKPSLYRTQVKALLDAASQAAGEGLRTEIEIMVPLVAEARELELIAGWIREVAADASASGEEHVEHRVGVMIETPRAALTAGAIAATAEFFSFGTNDLSQLTYGFSRDDVEARLMPRYLEDQILTDDPFEKLDPAGVGRLMSIAVEEARAVRPDISLGVCGEHGGEPTSIRLSHELGIDYVSCSPYRIPAARLAAAQAALAGEGAGE